ncbi:MAG: CPBP family intramembrane metalloprotease [Candidatus Kapabacteria bacterium]|nr:CPBP family intramembrane metalloprotease [Candidatus Kapabacteria bacterium]
MNEPPHNAFPLDEERADERSQNNNSHVPSCDGALDTPLPSTTPSVDASSMTQSTPTGNSEASQESNIFSNTPSATPSAVPEQAHEEISEKNGVFVDVPEIPAAKEEPFAHAKYGFAAVVSIFLMYQFAGGALHSAARNHSGAFEIVLQGLGQLLFMLTPSIIVMRYSPLKMQGLTRSGGEVTALQWAFGLLGIFGIQIFDAGFIALQERLVPSFMMPVYQQLRAWSDMVEQFYRTSFAGTTPWEAVRALLIGAVVPAFAEEILFRGLLQRSLEEVYPIRRAIVVTAIIFGILHFNPLSVLPLILIGAYLGFLAYYTQSLALPIVAHFLNNAIAIVALYAPSQGVEMSPYGISLGRALLFAFLGATLLVGAYLLMRRLTPQMPMTMAQRNNPLETSVA